jgi:hypothetical protein
MQQQPDNLRYSLMPIDTPSTSPGYTTPTIEADDAKASKEHQGLDKSKPNADDMKHFELDRLVVAFPQLKTIVVSTRAQKWHPVSLVASFLTQCLCIFRVASCS